MSTVTVRSGTTVSLDPSDRKVFLFDFNATNLAVGAALSSHVVTITALKQHGSTALTYDNDALAGSNRKVVLRLLATTAALWDLYRVSVKGITNETPSQEKEYSIKIAIEHH